MSGAAIGIAVSAEASSAAPRRDFSLSTPSGIAAIRTLPAPLRHRTREGGNVDRGGRTNAWLLEASTSSATALVNLFRGITTRVFVRVQGARC